MDQRLAAAIEYLREVVREAAREGALDVLNRHGPQPANDNEHVSLAEAARIWDVSYETVRAWVKSGRLKATRVGRVYRVSREDLEKVGAPAPVADVLDFDVMARRFRQRNERKP